jgi:hypothetical protein
MRQEHTRRLEEAIRLTERMVERGDWSHNYGHGFTNTLILRLLANQLVLMRRHLVLVRRLEDA